jgi:hypothetical protein
LPGLGFHGNTKQKSGEACYGLTHVIWFTRCHMSFRR